MNMPAARCSPLAMKCSCASHNNNYSSIVSFRTNAGLWLTCIYQVKPETVSASRNYAPWYAIDATSAL
jgi:hypothetical protein